MESETAHYCKIMLFCLALLFIKSAVQKSEFSSKVSSSPTLFIFGDLHRHNQQRPPVSDILASRMGLPPLPRWFQDKSSADISHGAVFSTLGSGILKSVSGYPQDTITLKDQVDEFIGIFRMISEASGYPSKRLLAASFVVIAAGHHDISDYFKNTNQSMASVAPQTFVESLLQTYQTNLQRLEDLGVSKFLLIGVCECSTGDGCSKEEAVMIRMFNRGLATIVMDMNAKHRPSHDCTGHESLVNASKNSYFYNNECSFDGAAPGFLQKSSSTRGFSSAS